MSGSHHHGNRNRLLVALCLTGLFTVVEAAAGWLTGSLALLADAGHMLTDTLAMGLAVAAFSFGARPADPQRSYGYQRLQILAAFANAIFLLAIVGWILFEAITRLLSPAPILANGMLIVAVIGLVVNIIAFLLLHGGDKDNLNMRGAAIHVLGDLLGSVAAIVAALVIIMTGWLPIDPLLSLLVALLVLRSAWVLLKRSAHILLEGTPDWLDVAAMQKQLKQDVAGISEIHHVHCWGITQENVMLTMHVVLENNSADGPLIVRQIKDKLASVYGIRHSTIEIERGDCADLSQQS